MRRCCVRPRGTRPARIKHSRARSWLYVLGVLLLGRSALLSSITATVMLMMMVMWMDDACDDDDGDDG